MSVEIMKTIDEREFAKMNKRKTNKDRKEQGEIISQAIIMTYINITKFVQSINLKKIIV